MSHKKKQKLIPLVMAMVSISACAVNKERALEISSLSPSGIVKLEVPEPWSSKMSTLELCIEMPKSLMGMQLLITTGDLNTKINLEIFIVWMLLGSMQRVTRKKFHLNFTWIEIWNALQPDSKVRKIFNILNYQVRVRFRMKRHIGNGLFTIRTANNRVNQDGQKRRSYLAMLLPTYYEKR